MAATLTLAGETYRIEIVRRQPRLVLRIDGRLHEVDQAGEPGPGRREIRFDTGPLSFARAQEGDRIFIRCGGRTHEVRHVDARDAAAANAGGLDEIRAPMPGAVVSVHRRPGDHVLRGEPLLTIESMKLQTTLASPRDGIVAEISRDVGDGFDKGAVVARLEPMAQEG